MPVNVCPNRSRLLSPRRNHHEVPYHPGCQWFHNGSQLINTRVNGLGKERLSQLKSYINHSQHVPGVMGCKTVAFQVSRQIIAGKSTLPYSFVSCNVFWNQIWTSLKFSGNNLRFTLLTLEISKLGILQRRFIVLSNSLVNTVWLKNRATYRALTVFHSGRLYVWNVCIISSSCY